MTRARADRRGTRKDLEFGYRMADAIAGARHRPDHLREAPGGGCRRGDGRHRRDHRPRRAAGRRRASPSSRWPSRSRTCGSTCRSWAWRRFEAMRAAGATVLSIDAGKTLMFDGDAFLASANEAGIASRRAGAMRVAVIGVGHLGRHHARILASLPGRRAGRRRRHQSRARRRGRAPSTARSAFGDWRELLGRVDRGDDRGADREPCSRSPRPFSIARRPRAGREADDADDGRGRSAVALRAASAACVLAVGHTERFNPAVAAASRWCANRASSRCTGSARFRSAASTSTWCST